MLPSSDQAGTNVASSPLTSTRERQRAQRLAGGDAMQETLETRVLTLEQTVEQQATVRDLEALQAVLSTQMLQLGSEIRGEFSALRSEVQAGDAETRERLDEQATDLRAEIQAGDTETRQHARMLHEDTRGLIEERTADLLGVVAAESRETRQLLEERAKELREEIQAGDAATRQHARTLHEDVIERIKVISRG
jgi:hypothetical protein